MKSYILHTLFHLSVLFLALKANSEDEDFLEIVISPKTKLFHSDGNVEFFEKKTHHDIVRRHNTCKIPSSLENSELRCKLFPSKVECNQTCIFGHTFPEGVSRHMRCKHDEDKWHPTKQFETCKPFVDCTLSYGPGASAKCYTNYMNKGPSCEVECSHYEDKDAVPPAMYQCDIQGKWNPKLPFCVKAGSGQKLVPRRG